MINLLLNAADALVSTTWPRARGRKKSGSPTRALSPEELADSFGPGRRKRKEDAPGRNSSLFRIPRDSHPVSPQEVRLHPSSRSVRTPARDPAEALGRIFEPFYSTKPAGREPD